MSEKLLIHIPHSGLELPEIFGDGLLVDGSGIEDENVFVSDYLVDMFIPKSQCQILKFRFSRLFCDVERFLDESQEVMASFGMGVVYLKTSKGNILREENKNYRDLVIRNYYNVHHQQLDNMVSQIVQKEQECYILDLHSFSDDFVESVLQRVDNPDICLGVDEGFYDEELLALTKAFFESKRYIVKINYPYSGSIVPNKFFNDNGKKYVRTMMIEINKRIYLDNNRIINEKKCNYLKIVMDEYYGLLNDYLKRRKGFLREKKI